MKKIYSKVNVNAKFEDITFCTNHKCRKKTCYRHICHLAEVEKIWHSEAMFEGTIYCLKEQIKRRKKEKKSTDEEAIDTLKEICDYLKGDK